MKKLKFYPKRTIALFVIVTCAFIGFFYTSKKTSQSNELNTNYEDCSFLMMDEDGIKQEFVMFRDAKTGKLCYGLYVVNNSKEDYRTPSYECTINQEYSVICSTYAFVKPDEEKLIVFSELNEGMNAVGIEKLTTLDFKVYKDYYYMQEDEEEEEEIFHIDVPKGLNPGILCVPFEHAKADEQVLLENENVKVTLFGLGHYLEDGSYKREFRGKVLFENKSEEAIPVGVLAAKVNNMEFNISGVGNMLDAGMSRFADFEISESDSAKLEDIYNVALLVLTDEKEITGTVNLEGGSWYEVELSSAADPKEIEVSGELILDTPELKVYYQGQTGMRWKYQEGQGQYFWNILVVNDSDQDVDLRMQDIKINGKLRESSWDDYVGILDGTDVGAHGKRYMQIKRNFENMEDRPTLSFTFQFRTRGGGSIIYTHPIETVIEPELHAKDIAIDE